MWEHVMKGKELSKRTFYLKANVRASGTKAHSGSVLMKNTPNPKSNELRCSMTND